MTESDDIEAIHIPFLPIVRIGSRTSGGSSAVKGSECDGHGMVGRPPGTRFRNSGTSTAFAVLHDAPRQQKTPPSLIDSSRPFPLSEPLQSSIDVHLILIIFKPSRPRNPVDIMFIKQTRFRNSGCSSRAGMGQPMEPRRWAWAVAILAMPLGEKLVQCHDRRHASWTTSPKRILKLPESVPSHASLASLNQPPTHTFGWLFPL
ncbi:hypothetical protein B0T13DRAFT_208761 [Neurospora crassa]|nr:hypothetical protein B0T13DRAFT_208761 [Neurospora crassa]